MSTKRYAVTMTRKITRRIVVEADNADAARAQVETYGAVEAMNDYPEWEANEDVTKIGHIMRLYD